MDKFTIITKDNCPFCYKAGELLKSKDKQYEFIYIEDEPYLAKLLGMADKRTVPQVFLGGTYIGGYSDLEEYLSFG